MADRTHARIDRVLRGACDAGQVPGVVAAVTDRRGVIYEGAFGSAQTKAQRPMRPDTVFRIASMTKVITSIAVMMLQQEGKLDLDAPFQRYFPEFRQPPVLQSFDRSSGQYAARPAAQPITVRQLLTHTSGFGYWFLNSELRASMGPEPEYYNPPFLLHEPGTRFTYGISTDVLGQLVAPVSGLSLDAFFAQRMFAPLDMRDTGFTIPGDVGRLASLHTLTKGVLTEVDNETAGEGPRGGGALYSTAQDFLRVLQLLLNGGELNRTRLLEAHTVQEMTRNQIGDLRALRQTTVAPERTGDFLFMDGSQKFGLGVLLETVDKPDGRAAGSYGWAGIFNTYFWVDPVVQIAAVLFMQTRPFSAPVCIDLYARFERAVYAALATDH